MVYPDHLLSRAVVRMNREGIRQLLVVERGETRKFLGIIIMSDIVSVQAETINETNQLERSFVPDLSETRISISHSPNRERLD